MINKKGYLNEDLLNGEDMTNVLTDSHNLVLKQVPDTNGSYGFLRDRNTKSYQLVDGAFYIFINAHVDSQNAFTLSGYYGKPTYIYGTHQDQFNINFNTDTKVVTITDNSNWGCRGYMYRVGNLESA